MSEILNIISKVPETGLRTGGPNKVFYNTIKGLEKIGQQYVLNKDIRMYKWNWIHDSRIGLIEAARMNIPSLLGPNIATLPKDIPKLIPSLNNFIYLMPSEWPIRMWKSFNNYNEAKLVPWPVGIDIEKFYCDRKNIKKDQVMIYYKRRKYGLLEKVVQIVKSLGLIPQIIEYGKYNESEFKNILHSSIFGIWLGVSESQGIAMNESLAANLPLIVIDVSSLFEDIGQYSYVVPRKLKKFKPTSAPYFDDRCGIVINDLDELQETIPIILNNIDKYTPVEYIQQFLSLERSAEGLISLFKFIKARECFNGKNYIEKNFRPSKRTLLIDSIHTTKRKFFTLFYIIIRNVKKVFNKN